MMFGCAGLVVLDCCLAGLCLYERDTCNQWHQTQACLKQYENFIDSRGSRAWTDGFFGGAADILGDVQQAANATGVQVRKIDAVKKGKENYQLELQGTLHQFIYFFNEMERSVPPYHVQLQSIQIKDEQVTALVTIQAWVIQQNK